MGSDQELAELLWRNGQVILNNQNHRKPAPGLNESKQAHKPQGHLQGGGYLGNSGNLLQKDDQISWLRYALGESLQKEFCYDLFYEMPSVVGINNADNTNKQLSAAGENSAHLDASKETSVLVSSGSVETQPSFEQFRDLAENIMPPPRTQFPKFVPPAFNLSVGEVVNLSHLAVTNKKSLMSSNKPLGECVSVNANHLETRGSSIMSKCGSNQVTDEGNLNRLSSNAFVGTPDESMMFFLSERVSGDAFEATLTSSSGGSRGSLGRTSKETTSNQSLKRKIRDAEESDCQSEEMDFESTEASEPNQRSTSACRSRAAEVHNLSERKRRDRINEKMKALQELIPHSNKSDKASMLDEAIEYLKSLQLQVQMMWIGSGLAPMMFPGVRHYMSTMGMGVGPGPIPNPLQFPRVPLIDQTIMPSLVLSGPLMCPPSAISPVNFQNYLQHATAPEPYARYVGFHPVQAMHQRLRHGLVMVLADSSGETCSGGLSKSI